MTKFSMKSIVVGPLQTNCYFISNASEFVIIDPGGDFKRIMDTAATIPGDPASVICTHGHFDHVMVADILADALHTTFAMHAKDLEILRRTWDLGMQFGITGKPPRPGHLIDFDHKLRIGREDIIVKNTPGHTPGSISLVAGNSIFTGDCLFRGNIGRMDLGGDSRDMVESLKWLLGFPSDTAVYPGHGPPTTIGAEHDNLLGFIRMLSNP